MSALLTNLQVELSILRTDSIYYWSLLTGLTSSGLSQSIVIRQLLPYLALFVVESDSYLTDVNTQYAKQPKLEYLEMLVSMRNRHKFTGEKRDQISTFLKLWETIAIWHHKQFLQSHTGHLAWLKRAIQPDLGLAFYKDILVSSTFGDLYNMAFDSPVVMRSSDIERISEVLYFLSMDCGKHVAFMRELAKSLPDYRPLPLAESLIDDKDVSCMDVKAGKLLSRVFDPENQPAATACLLHYLTVANFMAHFFEETGARNSETAFKIKFLALFEIRRSLEMLRNYSMRRNFLGNQAQRRTLMILKEEGMKQISSQGKFRDILVHYKLNKITGNQSGEQLKQGMLDVKVPLCGLVEYHFGGMKLDDVRILVDALMTKVSLHLDGWFQETGGARGVRIPCK